jgi:hypothetical protein
VEGCSWGHRAETVSLPFVQMYREGSKPFLPITYIAVPGLLEVHLLGARDAQEHAVGLHRLRDGDIDVPLDGLRGGPTVVSKFGNIAFCGTRRHGLEIPSGGGQGPTSPAT